MVNEDLPMPSNSENPIYEIVNQVADEQRQEYFSSGWWHSIDLGGGRITPGAHKLEELQENFALFQLPEDLAGQRVLDIGCWDGFYSFEAERRGAEVVAVDCWRPEKFFVAHAALQSRVQFHELSVYEVTKQRLGTFDIVFFLGVLYHLRHPLLALERVCEVTRGQALIESHVIDHARATEYPNMEFYEWDELGGQYDNWWGPNSECMLRMTRAAGFARVEALRPQLSRNVLKAQRRWAHWPQQAQPSLHLRAVTNAISFQPASPVSGRHAFLALWVDGLATEVKREHVRVEVGGYGIAPYFAGPSFKADGTLDCIQVNVPVPPGLDAGTTNVRVCFEAQTSNEVETQLIPGSEW
jgi:tRNA (mo5U34)-methyltransferase